MLKVALFAMIVASVPVVGIYAQTDTIPIIIESPDGDTIIEQSNDEIRIIVKSEDSSRLANGDILVSSATILAFLGFGLFFTIRGPFGKNSNLIFNQIRIILILVLIIIISHLTLMNSIVQDTFTPFLYDSIIWITAACIFGIISTMILLNRTLSHEEKQQSRMYEKITDIIQSYDM